MRNRPITTTTTTLLSFEPSILIAIFGLKLFSPHLSAFNHFLQLSNPHFKLSQTFKHLSSSSSHHHTCHYTLSLTSLFPVTSLLFLRPSCFLVISCFQAFIFSHTFPFFFSFQASFSACRCLWTLIEV